MAVVKERGAGHLGSGHLLAAIEGLSTSTTPRVVHELQLRLRRLVVSHAASLPGPLRLRVSLALGLPALLHRSMHCAVWSSTPVFSSCTCAACSSLPLVALCISTLAPPAPLLCQSRGTGATRSCLLHQAPTGPVCYIRRRPSCPLHHAPPLSACQCGTAGSTCECRTAESACSSSHCRQYRSAYPRWTASTCSSLLF